MYISVVAFTMLLFPVGSILIEHVEKPDTPVVILVGKWFVFWSVGVRLVLAGVRQTLQPRFTAAEIFHMKGDEALPLVRELGIANLAMGTVGLFSLAFPSFVLPASISACIYFGIAGIRHAFEKNRLRNEKIAMVSDLFLFVVLGVFLVKTFAFGNR